MGKAERRGRDRRKERDVGMGRWGDSERKIHIVIHGVCQSFTRPRYLLCFIILASVSQRSMIPGGRGLRDLNAGF